MHMGQTRIRRIWKKECWWAFLLVPKFCDDIIEHRCNLGDSYLNKDPGKFVFGIWQIIRDIRIWQTGMTFTPQYLHFFGYDNLIAHILVAIGPVAIIFDNIIYIQCL